MHPAGPKLIFCLFFCVFPLIYHMHNSYITYIVGMLCLDVLTCDVSSVAFLAMHIHSALGVYYP